MMKGDVAAQQKPAKRQKVAHTASKAVVRQPAVPHAAMRAPIAPRHPMKMPLAPSTGHHMRSPYPMGIHPLPGYIPPPPRYMMRPPAGMMMMNHRPIGPAGAMPHPPIPPPFPSGRYSGPASLLRPLLFPPGGPILPRAGPPAGPPANNTWGQSTPLQSKKSSLQTLPRDPTRLAPLPKPQYKFTPMELVQGLRPKGVKKPSKEEEQKLEEKAAKLRNKVPSVKMTPEEVAKLTPMQLAQTKLSEEEQKKEDDAAEASTESHAALAPIEQTDNETAEESTKAKATPAANVESKKGSEAQNEDDPTLEENKKPSATILVEGAALPANAKQGGPFRPAMSTHEVLRHLCGFYLADDECSLVEYMQKNNLGRNFRVSWEDSKLEEYKDEGKEINDFDVKGRLQKYMDNRHAIQRGRDEERYKDKIVRAAKQTVNADLRRAVHVEDLRLQGLARSRIIREDFLFRRFTELLQSSGGQPNRDAFVWFLKEVDETRTIGERIANDFLQHAAVASAPGNTGNIDHQSFLL